jgi:hypothetical protein
MSFLSLSRSDVFWFPFELFRMMEMFFYLTEF